MNIIGIMRNTYHMETLITINSPSLAGCRREEAKRIDAMCHKSKHGKARRRLSYAASGDLFIA